jgi:hypothetical protein
MEKKETKSKFDQRGKSRNPNKLRNLPQYRDMDENEFQKVISSMEAEEFGVGISKIFEERIEEKLAKFEEDYDLSDLKINDREVLRGLVQSIISLEDYEQAIFTLRAGGIGGENLLAIDKLQKVMEGIRKSISDAQNDLAITRKHRRSDQQTSVIDYIDSLKDKAKKFKESREAYVLCPKCATLLMTCWSLYPTNPNNRITLTCLQKDKDGLPCNTKFTVTTKEMFENKQSNRPEVLPQSLT